MSEKTPISLHNSDLFLKPEFKETNQKSVNRDTFNKSVLKKGPSLGENNHIKPLYTADLLPSLQVYVQNFSFPHRSTYFNKASTLYANSPISVESEMRKQRLKSVSQRSKNKIDKLKYKTSKGQFPLKYELRSGFISSDNSQLELQNKYYLRSKSRFSETAERLTPKKKSGSNNYNYPVCNEPSLSYKIDVKTKSSHKQVLLKSLPSLIRSGISKEFLLVTINLVLLSILAIVHRNNYGKGSSPIISKGPNTILCASKTPNISSSLQNEGLHHHVAQKAKQSSWQYLNQIQPGYLSFVLQRKLFTVPWQDQKQEKYVGAFLGELNFNPRVTDNLDRSSKHKQMRLVNGEESLFLSLPQFVEPKRSSGYASDTVSFFNNKSLNKDCKTSFCTPVSLKSTAEKKPSFCIEKKKCLPFDRGTYVYCKWEYRSPASNKNEVFVPNAFAQITKKFFQPLACDFNLHLTRTELWPTNKILSPAMFVDCVIKPWYCMRAYNTSNDNIVATRSVQRRVDNSTLYKNPKIQGFQYYMPYYTSQERIFAESDKIPSKRGTIYSDVQNFSFAHHLPKFCLDHNFDIEYVKTKSSHQSDQLCLKQVEKQKFVPARLVQNFVLPKTSQNYNFAQAKLKSLEPNFGRSSIITSQFLLKRCFYKYGFFVISSFKKINEFQISKEERNYLTKSPYINNMMWRQSRHINKQCLGGITETKNHTINQINDQSVLKVNVTQTESHSRAIPQKIQVNVKSSCIPGDHINLALYKNIDTLYFKPNVDQRVAPTLSKPNFVTEGTFSQAWLNRNKIFVKGDTVKIGKHSPIFTKIDNFSKLNGKQNKRSIKRVFFQSTFAWSKYNLCKIKANAFAQGWNGRLRKLFKEKLFEKKLFEKTKSCISIFNFIPDNLVQNTSVSGYKFPELNKKEIVYLFRQKAILNFYLYVNRSNKKKVFDKIDIKTSQKLLNQITTPFHTLKSYDLINQVLSARNEFLIKAKEKYNKTELNSVVNKASEISGIPSNLSYQPDRFASVIDLKMQYTQVNLDEIRNVKEIFSRMGRDYEEYLRQPKDSLPALIISPSLEDDREIEEEGIQIFRKRDFIKNKTNTGSEVGEGKTFTEHAFDAETLSPHKQERNNDLNLNTTSFSATQEFNKSEKTESKSEIQNRQNLVRNALRQAQEEIDNIAKKEEKGNDKDKQVIPPLTRLEALYTIRNRERKREKAKDLTSSKNTTSSFRLRASKNLFHVLIPRFGLGKSQNKTFTNRYKNDVFVKSLPVVKNTSLPFFEELFLYSDKLCNADLKNTPNLGLMSRQSLHINRHNCILTPWLFSKLGDSNLCTDRKHSFFGEMSLLPNKLTAQEQKRIFQQKVNPLLKVNTKNIKSVLNTWTEENHVFLDVNQERHSDQIHLPSLSSSRVYNSDQQKSSHLDITQSFQIGTRLLPETMSGLQSKALLKSLPSPIYFYNNLSQNKACQASAPKIKGTPLGSPVYNRVWQPKRMEPSTFRVSSRSQSTPVVPIISQEDWKNMIQWQLKKHFFEEDKRLLSLSLNKKKSLKIKKINLYLPWISIKRAENDVENSSGHIHVNKQSLTKANFKKLVYVQNFSFAHKPEQNRVLNKAVSENEWPLTRLDFTKSNPHFPTNSFSSVLTQSPLVANGSHLHRQDAQLHVKTSNYWRLPVQQAFSTITWPVKKQERPYFSQKEQLGTVNKSRVRIPQKELGIGKKICNESILFESVTRYSWLFVYTFVFVLMFQQLFNFVYKVGFKDFFIKFLNSEFGRTITSEEFRYSIQNSPLTEFYTPKKRLQELLGLEKNKVQLLEVVWFLRNKCQGRNGPRGILLVGPPGVENVSVVQAIAGEAKVPIIVQSLEKIAQDNEPQRQLEQLYMRAQKQAPCVLFLDQLDTIGARRDQLFTNQRHAHNLGSSITEISDQEEYNVNAGGQNLNNSGNKLNVVLRLLTILDGITQSSGVVTVATAQDLSKLDPALLRPKRFDRRIYLSLPNQQDRIYLLKTQTQSIGHVKKMPWDYLSLQTENMSTADIKSAINYSLFRAVLKNNVHTLETLEYGIDCVKTLTNKRVDKK